MPALNFLPFGTPVQRAAAAVQGKAAALIKLTPGSTTLAILEAGASVALWLQWLAIAILSSTRLATSQGEDVDTWLADFNLTRLPANFATGPVEFLRYTATNGATITVGDNVRSGDLTRTYTVAADPTNPYYDATVAAYTGGYILPAGVESTILPVICTVAGTIGNVVAGGISLIGTAMPGIDVVNNLVAITNGADAETDAAFKARFPLYIASLSRGTVEAVEAAVAGVQEGLTYSVQVNTDEAGNHRSGWMTITVDDGSGIPSAALLTSVTVAVQAVKSACEGFSVQPPTLVQVNVSMTIAVGSGATKSVVAGKIVTALTSYIDSLPINTPLNYSRVSAIAYAVDPVNILNISGILVNGAEADVMPGIRGVVKLASAPTVN